MRQQLQTDTFRRCAAALPWHARCVGTAAYEFSRSLPNTPHRAVQLHQGWPSAGVDVAHGVHGVAAGPAAGTGVRSRATSPHTRAVRTPRAWLRASTAARLGARLFALRCPAGSGRCGGGCAGRINHGHGVNAAFPDADHVGERQTCRAVRACRCGSTGLPSTNVGRWFVVDVARSMAARLLA